MRNRAHSFSVLMYALYKKRHNVQYRQQKATKKWIIQTTFAPNSGVNSDYSEALFQSSGNTPLWLGEYTTLSSNDLCSN